METRIFNKLNERSVFYATSVQSRDCVKIGSPDPPTSTTPSLYPGLPSPPPILASLSTQHNDQLTTVCLQITNLGPQYTF